MEYLRASGRAGNWKWRDDSEYTRARAVLAAYEADGCKELERTRRKLRKRDEKIAGQQRYIQQLEEKLSRSFVSLNSKLENLPRDITKSVERALCNVRMIPVHGISSNDKIVEIRNKE
jgi:hypothetical protein